MKIPKTFVPEKDLTDKIKEYIEYTLTNKALHIALKENKELYDKIVNNMAQKLGYDKDTAEIVLKNFCSYTQL